MDYSRTEWDRFEAAIRPSLFMFAKKLTGGDETLAEDLVQIALADAWRTRANFDPNRGSKKTPVAVKFKRWIQGTIHHKYLDHKRRAMNREMPLSSTGFTESMTPANQVVDVEKVAVANASLSEMLSRLDPCEKKIALMLSEGENDETVRRTYNLSLGEYETYVASMKHKLRDFV